MQRGGLPKGSLQARQALRSADGHLTRVIDAIGSSQPDRHNSDDGREHGEDRRRSQMSQDERSAAQERGERSEP